METKIMKRQEERTAYLLRELKVREVVFSFRKADGTLRPDLLPPLKGAGRHNPDLITYWDVDKCAWRSFRKDNLLAVDWYDKE